MSFDTGIVPSVDVAPLIRSIRDQRVIIDSDLAVIYGVTTGNLNKAVKRNLHRFPSDFMFQLTHAEAESLIFQFGRSKRRGGRRHVPYAFTEHGALMASTVLNSLRAVAMSLYIIRAFVKVREELAANAAILKRMAEIDKTLLTHDLALRDIYQKLRPLLEPPPQPPKPEIGFHIEEEAIPYRVRKSLSVTVSRRSRSGRSTERH